MREPLIPRSDWLADFLNALFLRRVWRPPATGSTPPDRGIEAAVNEVGAGWSHGPWAEAAGIEVHIAAPDGGLEAATREVRLAAGGDASGICEECGNNSTGRYCNICTDPKRERAYIMVVSDPAAIAEAEASGYTDVYHVHSPVTDRGRETPFRASGSRLLARLLRYRAVGVFLNLGDDDENLAERQKLQDALAGKSYSVVLPPFPWQQTAGQPPAAPAAYASGAGPEADEQWQGPDEDPGGEAVLR